jgi:hypothetical protein
MTIIPGIDLTIDADAAGGANPLVTESGGAAGKPRWVAGDVFDLRLSFVAGSRDVTSGRRPAALPASWAILFLVKETPFDPTAHAGASGFGVTVDGDKTFYTALLNLNTEPLTRRLQATERAVEFWAELQLQDSGGNVRQSYQFKVDIGPKVHRGEGGPPVVPLPEYPPPGAIPVALRGTYAVPAGSGSLLVVVNHDRDYTPVVSVRAPNGSAPFITARTRDVTRESFMVDFSATIQQGGYHVDVIGL